MVVPQITGPKQNTPQLMDMRWVEEAAPTNVVDMDEFITNQLEKFDGFDIIVHPELQAAFEKICSGRGLKWVHPEVEWGNPSTRLLVVGVEGYDFDKHEEDR